MAYLLFVAIWNTFWATTAGTNGDYIWMVVFILSGLFGIWLGLVSESS